MRYVPQSFEEQTKVDVMELLGWTVTHPAFDSEHTKRGWLYANPPATVRDNYPIPVIADSFEDAFNYFLRNKDRYEKTSMVSLLPQRL
jgi:hypothetical protein